MYGLHQGVYPLRNQGSQVTQNDEVIYDPTIIDVLVLFGSSSDSYVYEAKQGCSKAMV